MLISIFHGQQQRANRHVQEKNKNKVKTTIKLYQRCHQVHPDAKRTTSCKIRKTNKQKQATKNL